jgi:hypothetical protein
MLYSSVKSNPKMVAVGMGKIRYSPALPDTGFKNPVHALTGPFNKAASGKSFRKAAVTGRLLPKYILKCNALWKSARAAKFDSLRILSDIYLNNNLLENISMYIYANGPQGRM